jgi:hypothetical protein
MSREGVLPEGSAVLWAASAWAAILREAVEEPGWLNVREWPEFRGFFMI